MYSVTVWNGIIYTWGSPPGLWWSGWCGCTQTSASPRTRCYRPRECSSSSESFGYTFIWYGGLVIWIIWLYIHLIRGPHHLNHLVVHSSDTGTSPSELFGYTFIWYGDLTIWIIWFYIHMKRSLVIWIIWLYIHRIRGLVIWIIWLYIHLILGLVIWIIWFYIHLIRSLVIWIIWLYVHSSDTEPRHLNHLVICTFIWYGASSSESFVYKFGYKFIWYGGLSFIHLIRRTFVLNNGHQSYKKNRLPFQTNSVMIIDKLRIPHAINLNNRNTWQLSS